MYTPSGYLSVILTANDKTEPDKRPKELTLPAKSTDSDAQWALVAKYSLAFAGPFQIEDEGCCDNINPCGVLIAGPFTTATLPSYIGLSLSNNYTFYENGQVLHLLGGVGGGYVQDLWFTKLPTLQT